MSIANFLGIESRDVMQGRLFFQGVERSSDPHIYSKLYATRDGVYLPEFLGKIIVWIQDFLFPSWKIDRICILFERVEHKYEQKKREWQNQSHHSDEMRDSLYYLILDLEFVRKIAEANRVAFEQYQMNRHHLLINGNNLEMRLNNFQTTFAHVFAHSRLPLSPNEIEFRESRVNQIIEAF